MTTYEAALAKLEADWPKAEYPALHAYGRSLIESAQAAGTPLPNEVSTVLDIDVTTSAPTTPAAVSSAALDERTRAIRVTHLDMTLAQAQNVARRQLVEEGIAVPPLTSDQFAALSKVEQAAVTRAINEGELPAIEVADVVLTPAQKAIRGMDLTEEEQTEVFGPILAAQEAQHAASKVTRERAPFADARGEDIQRDMNRLGITEAEAEARHPWEDYTSAPAVTSSTKDLQDQMRGLGPSDMGLVTADES